MTEQIHQLKTNNISSTIYTISPAQIEYIAQVFAHDFANTMNMRTFAGKIRQIAERSLHTALTSAKHMGEKK